MVGADDDLAGRLVSGERRALARAITLIESARADHRESADSLLRALLPRAGRSVRLGISGVPGVGKSTFIEAFGLYLIGQGHKVAVLAVDPSSRISGGSILGDKTRMADLARHPSAFIRPSPSGGALGGVTRRTRESIIACEAAGFDVILVETVGVGQSETAVKDMVDLFLLLLLPAAGDELQGIKRGVVESADLVVVNKADGDLKAAAQVAQADYRGALGLLRPEVADWRPPVLTCSSLTGDGLAEIWAEIERFITVVGGEPGLAERRGRQAAAWLWSEVKELLLDRLSSRPGFAERMAAAEARVRAGTVSAAEAADDLVGDYFGE